MSERGAATVGGVALAAGASRRAKGCKALAELEGEPLVRRAARTMALGGCDDVLVVVGPPHASLVAEAVSDLPVAANPFPERGMLSSLRHGLWRAMSRDHAALVVSLVDHPRVCVDTVVALVRAWRRLRPAVVVPEHRGRRGHPYLVDRALFGHLLAAPDEQGPRPVLRAARRHMVSVEDPAVLDDLDTARALRRAGAVHRRRRGRLDHAPAGG